MFDLSPQQELGWLHHRLIPESAAYNFVSIIDFVGDLNVAALRQAIAAVVEHHSAMRIALVDPDSERPVQQVVDGVVPRIDVVDIDDSGAAQGKRDALLHRPLQRVGHEPPTAAGS